MSERVYLHIGAAKTGTSYLQLLLWHNRDALRDQGVYLPLRRRRDQFDAVSDLRGGMWAERPLQRTWDDLAARVHKLEGTAVVSEELLCASGPEHIERVVSSLQPAEVHVILTARDIGRQVPAEWQQVVRARGVSTYDHFLEGLSTSTTHPFWNIQDPVGVHGRWSPYLADPAHFHLVTVPPRGAPASRLWERFASVIGADPSCAEAPSLNQNESLGLVETELLRRFNDQLGEAFPLRAPYIDVVRKHFTVPALMGTDNERIGVPEEYAAWLRTRSEEMVRQVEGLAGKIDVVGDAQDLLAGDIALADRSPGEVTDQELLERALLAITRQLTHVQDEEDARVAAALARKSEETEIEETGGPADESGSPSSEESRKRRFGWRRE